MTLRPSLKLGSLFIMRLCFIYLAVHDWRSRSKALNLRREEKHARRSGFRLQHFGHPCLRALTLHPRAVVLRRAVFPHATQLGVMGEDYSKVCLVQGGGTVFGKVEKESM
jgi:hypothetical protein